MSDQAPIDTKVERLLPLERFDCPQLHRRPTYIMPAAADEQMAMILDKDCAGLRHDLRSTGANMRQAFISGHFDETTQAALQWTIYGMRDELFPTWHSLCALTIFELARGMSVLGAHCGGYAGYLNQWGTNPDHPLPPAHPWIIYPHDLSHIPQAAVEMDESDPRREDFNGVSLLNVDGLRYGLWTKELRRLRADLAKRRGSASLVSSACGPEGG